MQPTVSQAPSSIPSVPPTPAPSTSSNPSSFPTYIDVDGNSVIGAFDIIDDGMDNATGSNLDDLDSDREDAGSGNGIILEAASNETDVFAGDDDDISNSTRGQNATNITDDAVFIHLPPVSGKTPEVPTGEQTEATRTALAVSMPLIAALLIGLLLYKKQRRTLTASEYNEMMASDFVMVGTGDPPGSFHEGLYHYTKDGRRYLSTRCENCLETRRNTFYTDRRGLPTIMEHEVYNNESNNSFVGVISPDSKDLGQRHLGIDVHRCTSSTCTRCNNGDHQTVNFIPSTAKTRASALRNQEFCLTQEEAAAYRSYGSDDSSGEDSSDDNRV
ncbi:expressed unknown protein [Seminavis robusta]|uniref:Uncharacterized protein n=1 Tax=Seminavis robusta TaxID=568900 RepID=A0A9N8HG47_9STRA|nr:expressed unknown protein [Seminavis robusta]|eukprot:Sro557_g166070.1 n/a (330) ;mRNA; f:6634-7623